MMDQSRFKGISLGLLIGLLGAVVSLTRWGSALEERFGLQLLFMLRGARSAPSSVVIVGMDEQSADFLDLPKDTRKWPRALHAQLIDRLNKAGAAMIVFDIAFRDSLPEDAVLARAMRDAGNVVLVEVLEEEKLSIDDQDRTAGQVTLMRRIPPIEPLARESLLFAPFTLPKGPGKVGQFWTFQDQLEDRATLPVVALQLFSDPVLKDFIGLIAEAQRQSQFSGIESLGRSIDGPDRFQRASSEEGTTFRQDQIHSMIQDIKKIFKKNTALSGWMLERVKQKQFGDRQNEPLLKALINAYAEGNSRYLNFYGPPRSIATIPFFKALSPTGDLSRNELDLRQKVVFVGASSLTSVQQKDGFYTPFTNSQGIDLSGVEILATAFANLLEDMPVRTVRPLFHFLLILGWGLAVGFIWTRCRPAMAALCSLIMVIGYIGIASQQFLHAGLWLPLVVPAFFQIPIACSGSMASKYLQVHRERKNIKTAFGFYLPNRVVDQISNNLEGIRGRGESVYGSCLYSDIANYTSLSERMTPAALRGLMNEYYDTIFAPIHHSGGEVMDLRGDAMLAIWAKAQSDPALKVQACMAAVRLTEALKKFNCSRPGLELHTRIGLHFGPIFLGNIGGSRHLEYRAVGDIVNTASRIENLNKLLRTQLLVSRELLADNDRFVARRLGTFLFPGKSIPLEIHELLGRQEEIQEDHIKLSSDFSEGLNLYHRMRWSEARERFVEILRKWPEDGPSLFYIQLCDKWMISAPPEPWDAVIALEKKS